MVSIFGNPVNYEEVEELMKNWKERSLEEVVSKLESNHCLVGNYLNGDNKKFIEFYNSLKETIREGSFKEKWVILPKNIPWSLAFNNRELYVGCRDKKIHVFDSKNGEKKSEIPVEDVPESLAVNNKYLFVGHSNNKICAFSIKSHEKKLEIPMKKTPHFLTIGDGELYAYCYKEIHAIDIKNCEKKWELLIENEAWSLAFNNNMLYVGYFNRPFSSHFYKNIWTIDIKNFEKNRKLLQKVFHYLLLLITGSFMLDVVIKKFMFLIQKIMKKNQKL